MQDQTSTTWGYGVQDSPTPGPYSAGNIPPYDPMRMPMGSHGFYSAPTRRKWNGHISALKSFRWALGAILSNWLVWLTVIFMTTSAVVGYCKIIGGLFFEQDDITLFALGLFTAFFVPVVGIVLFAPFIFSLGIAQLDKRKISFKDAFTSLRYFPVAVSVFLVVGLLTFVVARGLPLLDGAISIVLYGEHALTGYFGQGDSLLEFLISLTLTLILVFIFCLIYQVLNVVIWSISDGGKVQDSIAGSFDVLRAKFGTQLVISAVMTVVFCCLVFPGAHILLFRIGDSGVGLLICGVLGLLGAISVTLLGLVIARMYRQALFGFVT